MKKDEVRRIYDEAFGDPKGWSDWFFSEVYDDGAALTFAADGRTVSTLLMLPYKFRMHGCELPMD